MLSVLAVAPFANPHVTSIYDALAAREGLEVTRASLRPLPGRRLSLGWAEMPEDAAYLQPWRRLGDRWALRARLASADVAILPGPFHLARLPVDFAQRLHATRRPLLAWSEPFLAYRPRSRANLAMLRAVARGLDVPRLHLLSIGRAIDDYRALGVRSWPAWTFGFAVEPVEGLESCRRREARPPDAPARIAFAGELVPRKRVDLLLQALALPELAGAQWIASIHGDGPERSRLETLAAELGLRPRVRFEGPAPREAVRAALQEADALVLPSRFDGWGAAVNEALEAGLAVVASDACGSASLLAHGSSGMIFRSGDAADLARCLAPIVRDGQARLAMGREGRRAVEAWRPAAIAERLEGLCRGVVSGAPPLHAGGPLARLD